VRQLRSHSRYGVIATQLQDISGIVFLVSLSLWVLWPKKPGERMGRAWWSLPYSTNETRNTIASVTMLAWFVYMGARVGPFLGAFLLSAACQRQLHYSCG
jgi:hypothetical protein